MSPRSAATLNVLHSRGSPSSALIQQFNDASWIYTEALNNNAPAVDKAFRATYTPSSGSSAVSADILITADDYFTLYVNGQVVGDTRSQSGTGATVWATVHGYSVNLNIDGTAPIVFAIIVSNNANSAAGLLAAMRLTLSDGSSATLSSGGSGWRSTSSIPNNFDAPNLNDSGWSTPVTLSKNGASRPWGPIPNPSSLTDVSLSPSQGSSPPSSTTKDNTSSPTTAPGGNQNTGPTGPATTATGSGSTGGSGSNGSIPNTSATGANGNTSSGLSGIGGNTISGTSGATGGVLPSSTQSSAPVSSGSSSLPGNATSSPAQSGSQVPVGAIAGGVVGGVVIILLLILLWFFLRRKSRSSFAAATNPSMSEAPDSSSILSTRPRPFTAMESPFSHTRSDSATSDDPLRTPVRKGMAGIGYQRATSPISPSSASDGSRTEDLGATLAKIQELTAELNRGLADHGVNAPRVALTVANSGNVLPENSTLDNSSRMSGQLPPPYIDERRRT